MPACEFHRSQVTQLVRFIITEKLLFLNLLDNNAMLSGKHPEDALFRNSLWKLTVDQPFGRSGALNQWVCSGAIL